MPSLPDLPTELLLEIVKNYPKLYTNGWESYFHGVLENQFCGRDTLRSLSQTCRVLRGTFLPLSWAHVDIPDASSLKMKKIPYVMQYIRSLAITIPDPSEPIQFLLLHSQLLPNLKTLSIAPHLPRESFSEPYTSMRPVFPSVVTLTLPYHLASILHCFPNVQSLICLYLESTRLIKAATGLESIRAVSNIPCDKAMIECLRQVIPRVEMLSVWRISTSERAGMGALEGMDNLSQLHLRHNPWLRGSDVGQLPQIIEEGKKALETSKALGRKELRIQHLDEEKLLKETVFILDGDIWSSGAVHYPVVTLSDDY